MLDGLAVPLFYLLVVGGVVFWKLTTGPQRADALSWFWIGVLCFGGLGLLITVLSGGSITPTGP